MKHLLLRGLMALALMTSVGRPDVTIVSENQGRDRTMETTMRVAGGRMQIEAEQGSMILLPTENKMIFLVPEQQMYMVRNLKPVAPGAGTAAEAAPPTITRTGKKDTINGFDCEQVLVKPAQGTSVELWVSPQGPDFSEIAQSFQTLQSQGKSHMNMEWMKFMLQNKDLRTYPIRIITRDKEGNQEMETTVKSVSNAAIPASFFQPPSGYMEMTIPDGMGMGGGDDAPAGASLGGGTNKLQQIQQLQQQIAQNGKPPTPEQVQQLQDLAKGMQQDTQAH